MKVLTCLLVLVPAWTACVGFGGTGVGLLDV